MIFGIVPVDCKRLVAFFDFFKMNRKIETIINQIIGLIALNIWGISTISISKRGIMLLKYRLLPMIFILENSYFLTK